MVLLRYETVAKPSAESKIWRPVTRNKSSKFDILFCIEWFRGEIAPGPFSRDLQSHSP